MDALIFVGLAIAIWAVPAGLITAIIGVVALKLGWGAAMPNRRLLLIASIMPVLMLVYGFYLSWPWPWRQPEAMQDMLPAGPWLLSASIPAWLVCLLVSRGIFHRR